jgi:hypothetical protein
MLARATKVMLMSIVMLGATVQLTGACNYRETESESVAAVAATMTPTDNQAAMADNDQNEFRWRKQLAAGRVIEIKGVNGNVRAEAAAGGEAEVVATKRGRKSNPSEVEIRLLEHAGGVTICAVYPSGDASRPNGCEPGDAWRSHTRNNDVVVEFVVRVPAGVRFDGRTVNGEVEARSLGADVRAHTVNGGIEVSTRGYVEAKTVNGSINARFGNANWTGMLDFETVNGSIELELPADTSTDVRAETLNGDVTTDFPISVQGNYSKRKMSGVIGAGGRELALKTVNGAIRIRRAP